MINRIRHICASHLSVSPDTLYVSKFYHGDGERARKTIFLITDGTQPLYIFKIARSAERNLLIEREYAALKDASARPHAPFNIPHPIGHGELYGLAYSIERVVTGSVVSQQQAPDLISYVVEFERQKQRGGTVTVGALSAVLEKIYIDGPAEYHVLQKELAAYATHSLVHAHAHGDLTFRNIIASPDSTYTLIDWEYAPYKPLWGIDFAHYILRTYGPKGNVAHMFPEIQDSLPPLCIIDRIYDILQKHSRCDDIERLRDFLNAASA